MENLYMTLGNLGDILLGALDDRLALWHERAQWQFDVRRDSARMLFDTWQAVIAKLTGPPAPSLEQLCAAFARVEDAIGGYCEARNALETHTYLQPNETLRDDAQRMFDRMLAEMMDARDALRIMLANGLANGKDR